MKRLGMFLFGLLSANVYADDPSYLPELPLDKITFQISAKQWVKTQTALLSVNINATLGDADLVKTRTSIMDTLNKIANGEWHLTQFDRSQDSSGLEKLFVVAQIRINQGSLTDVYKIAKSISKPGANYEISSIEFKPSLEEIQGIQAQVREQLYQKANEELSRINKIYPEQHYTIYNFILMDSEMPTPQPVSKMLRAQEINAMAMPAQSAPPMVVSNELTLSALVQVASNRQKIGN